MTVEITWVWIGVLVAVVAWYRRRRRPVIGSFIPDERRGSRPYTY